METEFNPDVFELEEYCAFVNEVLIGRVIPRLLEKGMLDNRIACCHVGDKFASLLRIPSEQRRYAEPEKKEQYSLLESVANEAGQTPLVPAEEALQKMEQQLRENNPNMDVKEVALRFKHYSRREYNGWEYVAVQHEGKTQNLKEAIILFHPAAFQINGEYLNG